MVEGAGWWVGGGGGGGCRVVEVVGVVQGGGDGGGCRVVGMVEGDGGWWGWWRVQGGGGGGWEVVNSIGMFKSVLLLNSHTSTTHLLTSTPLTSQHISLAFTAHLPHLHSTPKWSSLSAEGDCWLRHFLPMHWPF